MSSKAKKWNIKWGIRSRLTAAFVLVSLFPIGLLVFLSHWFTRENIRDDYYRKNATMVSQIASQLESVLTRSYEDFEALASNPALSGKGGAEEAVFKEMERLVEGIYSEVTLLDNAGYVIESTSETLDIRDESVWFRHALEKEELIMSSPQKLIHEKDIIVSVYIPIPEAESNARIIRASVPFERLGGTIRAVHTPPGNELYLLDASGNILISTDGSEPFTKFDDEKSASFWSVPGRGVYKTSASGEEFDFVTRLVKPAFQLESNRPWRIVWMENSIISMVAVRESTFFHILAALFGILLSAFLGMVAGNHLSKPVRCASDAARNVAEGYMKDRVPVDSGTIELDQLGESFNHMVMKLESAQGSLKDSLLSRTKMLKERERTTAHLRASWEAVQHALILVGPDNKVVELNSVFSKMFRFSPAVHRGASFEDIMNVITEHCGNADEFREMYASIGNDPGCLTKSEWVFALDRDRVVQVSSAPVQVGVETGNRARLWIFHDLTDQRQLSEQLRQAQKMEAVGRLAGGVAHDFNNLLTSICGNLAIVNECLEEKAYESAMPHLDTAQKAGARAGTLVEKLLAYSRTSTMQSRVCCLNDVVEDTRELLKHSLGPSISLELVCNTELWPVVGDSNQLQQVMMNLCVNARDAIAESGRIILRTGNVELSPRVIQSFDGESMVGEFVFVDVIDNGSGMSKEIQDKIFEPFFTTKEQGKGTGLGLSMCQGIVERHGGWIEIESRLGVGTRFRIFLPRTAEKQNRPDRLVAPIELPETDVVTGGLVLVVDDEAQVRMVAESILRRKGFEVVSAENGEEAVKISRELGDKIDIVVMDATMPVMCGKEAFEILANEFPERPVIICSGYIGDQERYTASNGIAPADFVQKPYQLSHLLEVVNRSLKSTREGGEEDVAIVS